jgi:hypothetical protein
VCWAEGPGLQPSTLLSSVRLSLQHLGCAMTGSRLLRIALIAVGVLLAGWLVLWMQNGEESTVVTDGAHCAICGKELPTQFQSSGECPYCLLKQGGKGRSASPGQSRRYLVPAILIGLFVALVGAHLVIMLRSHKRGAKEEPVCYFKCPGCKRKLRYPARQAGHVGRCPTCHKHLLFPSTA